MRKIIACHFTMESRVRMDRKRREGLPRKRVDVVTDIQNDRGL